MNILDKAASKCERIHKAKCIRFAEWITQTKWVHYDNYGKTWTDGSRIITTAELYNLFQSQNTNKKEGE